MPDSGGAPSTWTAPKVRGGGYGGLGREHIGEIQRTRILVATTELAAERGVSNVTVAHIVARSTVSRRTFYELFAGREQCFLAALEEVISRLATVVVPLHRRPGRWCVRMRDALTVVLVALDSDPAATRLVIVEALAAGPKALECRQLLLARIAAAVDGGREEAAKGIDPLPLTAEGVVGGALSLIHSRLVEDEQRPLLELLNPLMSMVVLPYLGQSAAQEEFQRPVHRTPAHTNMAATDPWRDLEMRLTYRTVRVLLAVGARPGASNREVADSSDIRDQGQISKLLNRLERLGLIENTGDSRVKGERNAWILTEQGASAREGVRISWASTSPSR
jgi:AcrR family transcriptional regulator/DNA-binding MarR family transcriptional regulator